MMRDRVQSFINEQELVEPGQRVGVGVSGGLDSTVLLSVLHALGYELVALHVNYGLRGAASDEDERLVRDLCARLAVPLHVTRVDPKAQAEEQGASLQAVARRQRYDFFAQVAQEENLASVAVAHHRDDQAETMLLNLFRGAGPEGLAGMAPSRPLQQAPSVALVRPLLEMGKEKLQVYAEQHDVPWRRDESNDRLSYRRNALRHEVLPRIEKHFGDAATDKVAEAASLMRAYLHETWQPELEARFVACLEEERRLSVEALREMPPVWQTRLILEGLQRWLPEAPQQASVAASVRALLPSQPGRRVELSGGIVWRDRAHLTFAPEEEGGSPKSGSLRLDNTLELAAGALRAESVADPPASLQAEAPQAIYLDRDKLDFPLRVRHWQNGDRFQPLGMDGTKLVSDFLTDKKVPPSEREDVLVVCSDGDIVWVVGYRPAAIARVQEDTEHLVKITFIPRTSGP